jgi:hypothetical protein
MKKQLFFSFFIFCTGSVLAQCPGAQTTNDGVRGASETMMGQTIKNSCAYSMTGLTIRLNTGNASTLTLNVRASACAGSILKSGTLAAGAGGSRNITLSSSLSLVANTTYFLELTGNNSDVQKILTHSAGTYTGGSFYYASSFGGPCQNEPAEDMEFSLIGSPVLPIELTSFEAKTIIIKTSSLGAPQARSKTKVSTSSAAPTVRPSTSSDK